ncbi:hypothetical protein [Microbulbifer discodermiae]|uniref:hypothetical protein n=1 Tax=Microbulbifer sp. 2201CG32-9 TaxID=3232309 RepID=UPI00345BE62D
MNNLYYQAFDDEPETAYREDVLETQQIFLGDEQIGEMHRRNEEQVNRSNKFHAVIKVNAPPDYRAGLAQGFGATREEAVSRAFNDTREKVQIFLQQLDALDRAIHGVDAA